MKEEEAMKMFELVTRNNLLPTTVDELVPLSFIGQSAVTFYRQKIKLMDQLKMTEAQRKATLSDGQDAGEMLLEIETRIGQIAAKEEQAASIKVKGVRGSTPSMKPPKHKRLGIQSHNRMKQSQRIAANPKIVEKVKAQAKANEDIPTKTAVLAEISYQKEKARREKAEAGRKENKTVMVLDQGLYINALDKCLRVLPTKPPKRWEEGALKEAKAKANIIIKRLEVFNG